ncbi:Na+-transporting NADH:ubiquinone oxidoreductase subunit C [Spirosomataceae bacterium TFI 002]|nr:Na+-transporting NADH:ubiquinone oxidoreductase subunit C [Spirosomataceae bacterium TFI 002]
MHNNRYTFLFAIGISCITAVILVLTSQTLKPLQEVNIALDKKSSILKSVGIYTTESAEIESIYNSSVTEMVVNSQGEVLEALNADKIQMKNEVKKADAERSLPLYVYNGEDGKYYIVPMYGVGLWGPIWGYVSIQDDFNTVNGSFFDHKGETPGLGAEISEIAFQDQFKGKKMLNDQNNFISVHVVKSSAKVEYGNEHRVDAISGGTITSVGVDEMIANCVEPYYAYFQTLK